MYLRTEEGKAGVVADDRVTVTHMGEDTLSDSGRELEGREGFVEMLG